MEIKLINTLLDFLPKTKDLIYKTEEEQLELIKNSTQILNTKGKYYDFCKEVADLFHERLSTNNPSYKWTLKNYSRIKDNIKRINNNQFSYLKNTIIKILNTDNLTIMNELNSFSEKVDWYPNKRRIKENDCYIQVSDPIEIPDIFVVCIRIVSLIQRRIKETAIELFKIDKDLDNVLTVIKETRDNKEKNEQHLKKIDEEFGYLKEFSILNNIYQEIRINYYNMLLEEIRLTYNIKNRNKLNENYKKNYQAKLEMRKERQANYDKKRRGTNYY